MRRVLPLVALSLLIAHPVAAQYGQYGQKKASFSFAGDALARYEWTLDIPAPDGTTFDENRYFLQARPRAEMSFGPVELGVGGQFNYSQYDNTKRADGTDKLIVRDNFYSRDVNFDVYYARVKAGPVAIEGGRMLMPLPLTELIWDKDLRPQGGALSLVFEQGDTGRFALRGIYTLDNHWFPDTSKLYGGSVELAFASGRNSQILLAGSYLVFDDLEGIDPVIRRQNSRDILGFIAGDYHVADVQVRLINAGQLPFQLVLDYCWNTAASEDNKGLRVEATLGALASSRVFLEYVYAKVDRDATLAAFNADDFYWGTGYEVNSVDVGSATSRKSSIHGIASWQRVRDRLFPEPADWIQRYRLEWRYEF
jgi:hypothetical protein